MKKHIDVNSVTLIDGNVVRLPRTINGVSDFYIRSVEDQEVYFINDNATVVKKYYENGFRNVIEQGDFKIINVGLAQHMNEIFEYKTTCDEAITKCKSLLSRSVVTGNQRIRIESIAYRARLKSKKSRTDFYNILRDVMNNIN